MVGLPTYRASLQTTVPSAVAASDEDSEIADLPETDATQSAASQSTQIPTRLVVHAKGTASIWFLGQAGGVYRIDYADTKAATPEEMQWKLAADDVKADISGWMEWVDAGASDRLAPGEVRERYYQVVLKTDSATVPGEPPQPSPPATEPAPGLPTDSKPPAAGGSPSSVPSEILELLQKRNALSEWNQSTAARNLAELQECARLGELVAGGAATDDALKDTLAKSRLRISMLMTFGKSLFQQDDRHHAQLFFEAIVQYHAKRATAKQVARCHLWLGKIHQDAGLEWQYVHRELHAAQPEFEAAATHYLAAKNVAATDDWVREAGWMGSAACYRELGDQEKRRESLQRLLAEETTSATQRDLASYLVASSYYEQKRYEEAAWLYQQMQARLATQVNTKSEEYLGQKQYLNLLATDLNQVAARQMEKTEGRVRP